MSGTIIADEYDDSTVGDDFLYIIQSNNDKRQHD